MAINTALQNQTCFNRQNRSVRSTSIDCSGPRYCLLNAGMNLNELQLIAAGRVIVCLTQDPRIVSPIHANALMPVEGGSAKISF